MGICDVPVECVKFTGCHTINSALDGLHWEIVSRSIKSKGSEGKCW